MHIRQIIIQGFKRYATVTHVRAQKLTNNSYKDQTIVEPFSPKHNVIVGRNGSGKSNFFAAIRFVLSDAYTQMGREERQALLHEGAGSAVMSAYVELIFDNSDERFPTGTEEVILRRSIGQKKDEYSLNRKNSTKAEVMNLLESAGFSKSNPYYIVPQGRITAITNMKDAERLNMLKEVAGTQIYVNRRTESVRIMEDAETKRSKVDEVLDTIRDRLDQLEEEKNELREFQDKDRERRCLEYTVHNRDKEALEEAMAEQEQARSHNMEISDENRELLAEHEAELESIDAAIAELQQQLRILSEEKAQLERERKETAKEKAAVEYDVETLVDGQNAAQQARTEAADELQDVQAQIAQREDQLQELLPRFNALREQERGAKQQLQDTEATRARLYTKQGRNQRYRSKRERDEDLRRQIDDINMQLATRKAIAMQVAEDTVALEQTISQLEADITSMRDRLSNRGDEQQRIAEQVEAAKTEKEGLNDRRKEIWREEAKLDAILSQAQQELEKAERFLSQMMDQGTARGLESVRRVVKQHNIEGAHGCLGELFDFPEKYKTAIEVTAGTSLFHYVVDNEEIANRIIDILQSQKGGRVTFMPLNRLTPKIPNLPTASDVVHMLQKLRFDERYTKAFQQVFGKTIVCPNLQAASQYARSHGVSAITPDGDRSDKKGALTGGYHDTRNSRIDAIKRFAAARRESEEHSERKAELSRELRSLDQQVTKAGSDLQKLQEGRQNMEGGYGPLADELKRRDAELHSRRDELERKQRQRDNLESLVRDQSQQLSDFERELATPFKKELSDAEERQLKDASDALPSLRTQTSEISAQRAELETQKTEIEIELRENLRLRLDQLLAQDADADATGDGTGSSTRLRERQKDLKRISKALDAVTAKLAENERAIDEAQQQMQAQETSRVEKQQEVDNLNKSIREQQRSLQKFAQKRGGLLSRLNDVEAAIRGLGALPELAHTPTYRNMSAQTATTRLHKAKDVLKKYGHVNRKAFEQFQQFEKQRDMLESRRKELGTSDGSIHELINHLDLQKDEAIERTFRQVSKEFAKIFEKLVPAGKGRLIIQRRQDKAPRGDDSDEDDEREAAGTVENYTGVGISVSFNSKHDDQQRIQQLSGGQKSLCALTLIFAIQASDPAPFYLFDEIDANLDAQYRTAVASLIEESAETGQFICTTFRPEMLRVADKCYGVAQQRKASSINVVQTHEALEFVEGQVSGK
jgi:structural maintenance of chromosome 3 (chondroitin sulfate proteoglycan 6)